MSEHCRECTQEQSHAIHHCESCGAEIASQGWNSTYGQILRCSHCRIRRTILLQRIKKEMAGKQVEVVYLSMRFRNLISVSDIPEIGYRRDEKMNGLAFQVIDEETK